MLGTDRHLLHRPGLDSALRIGPDAIDDRRHSTTGPALPC